MGIRIRSNIAAEHKQTLPEFCNEYTCCNNIRKALQPIPNQQEKFVQIVGLCVFELPPCKGKLNMHANDLQLPNQKRRKNAKGARVNSRESHTKTHYPLTYYK